MVLYVIGLGLGDEKDITVKGLEAVQKCKRVYLEHYTAILSVGQERLEAFYKRPLILADREMVEQKAHEILRDADKEDVALLVVGDPFAATTHADFILRATEKGIPFVVMHNASIMNAVAVCGLQLYSFGKTITIPYFTEKSRPDSFYDKVMENQKTGSHTLVLLDIQVKEQSYENLLKGRRIFEPARFMSNNIAIEQLWEIEERRGQGVTTKNTFCIGLARVGQETQMVAAGTMEELHALDWGLPLHAMVIPGEMHVLERELVDFYHWKKVLARRQAAGDSQ